MSRFITATFLIVSIEVAQKVSNYFAFIFNTTAFQFNVELLGNKHGHCKDYFGLFYYIGLVCCFSDIISCKFLFNALMLIP